ncbi:MAG: hypothetical protein ACOX6S_14390 [Clostridia bacterium]
MAWNRELLRIFDIPPWVMPEADPRRG